MANPFKPDDKVRIKVKGADVEATVRLVWNDEVQVRTADKALLWRTVKTVWPPKDVQAGQPTPQQPAAMHDPKAPDQAALQTAVTPPETPTPTGDMAGPALVEVQSAGAENAQPEPPAPTPNPATPATKPDASAVELSSCGVPETVADMKRARRKGRRK
jgi:hypothetical protein